MIARFGQLCALLLMLWVPPNAATADPMPVLGAQERAAWQAVGKITRNGPLSPRGCSGTLIAPDLVVTAAHCVLENAQVAATRHYLAGWDRGRFEAERVSKEITVHPLYAIVTGPRRVAFDIALVQLAEPIPADLVTPMPLLAADGRLPQSVWLVGYQNGEADALAGREGCPVDPRSTEDWRIFGCEVVSGTSGGAVIVRTADGPVLAGVIVARRGPEGYAVTLPVNRWLRDAWFDAQARARSRQ